VARAIRRISPGETIASSSNAALAKAGAGFLSVPPCRFPQSGVCSWTTVLDPEMRLPFSRSERRLMSTVTPVLMTTSSPRPRSYFSRCVIRHVRQSHDGAVVTFDGCVRKSLARSRHPLSRIRSYESMALEKMKESPPLFTRYSP